MWWQERAKLVCQVPEAPQVAITPAFGRGQPHCRVLACSGSTLELWELPLLSPEVLPGLDVHPAHDAASQE